MQETQRNEFERRTLLHGAAWSVPIVATAIAVPVASASTNCTLVTNDYQFTGTNIVVNVPAGATYVDYTVRGAGGGSDSGVSGMGALITGRITFDSPSSPRSFVVIVGEGGAVTRDGSIAAGGVGYGRGGNSTPGPRTANPPTGGGGGGSALVLNDAALTPIVVAGGGGGSAITHALLGSTKLVQTLTAPALGFQYGLANAGGSSGNGRTGGMSGVAATTTALATSPAIAASGASGGAGGGSTQFIANSNWTAIQLSGGFSGGNFGSGLNGGGDGGNGSERLSNGNEFSASGGGGGGGYAGGGGGGMVAATFQSDTRKTISAGSGAAGSSFTSGNSQGLTNVNAGFESSGLPSGANRGHNGFIRLVWCV